MNLIVMTIQDLLGNRTEIEIGNHAFKHSKVEIADKQNTIEMIGKCPAGNCTGLRLMT